MPGFMNKFMNMNIHTGPFNNHEYIHEYVMKYTYEIHEQMHEKQRKHLKLLFFSFIYKNKQQKVHWDTVLS